MSKLDIIGLEMDLKNLSKTIKELEAIGDETSLAASSYLRGIRREMKSKLARNS